MKVVSAGTAITAEFTDTPPTYNELRNGWYDTDDRYVLSVFKDSGGGYADMGLMPARQSIWDKNGNEVISMLVETKVNNTTGTLANGANTNIVVSGFSWTPDTVLDLVVYVGLADDTVNEALSLGSGKIVSGNAIWIRNVSFGSGTVTLNIRNTDGGERYWESAIVTAAKTS